MSFALRLSFPNLNFDSTPKGSTTMRLQRVQFVCNSSSSSKQTDSSKEESEDESGHGSDGSRHRVVLVERYGNGTSKRYILDDDFHLTTFLENESKSSGFSLKELPWLPDIVKDFVLPAGFPGSVSDDYLEYMLLQFPTNVTGWICHTLVTSSLLKIVVSATFGHHLIHRVHAQPPTHEPGKSPSFRKVGVAQQGVLRFPGFEH